MMSIKGMGIIYEGGRGDVKSLTLGEQRPIRQMGLGDQGERVGQGCQSDIRIPGYQEITPHKPFTLLFNKKDENTQSHEKLVLIPHCKAIIETNR